MKDFLKKFFLAVIVGSYLAGRLVWAIIVLAFFVLGTIAFAHYLDSNQVVELSWLIQLVQQLAEPTFWQVSVLVWLERLLWIVMYFIVPVSGMGLGAMMILENNPREDIQPSSKASVRAAASIRNLMEASNRHLGI